MDDDQREATLQIRGVNHYYGTGELRVQILHGIDLTIRAGELVIMTGPSGCGKTTLLTLIGGLRKVQEGSLRVLGREMRGLDDRGLIDVRREIGFIFQAHNLFESLTALQNVRMSLELKPSDPAAMRRLAEQALVDVGLGERVSYKPKGLSGGQRQRVAVARALVNKPKLILADEPTAALDSKSTELVLDQMRRLTRQGCTILIVTHDVKILNLADRVISMAEGQIKSNTAVTESIRICMFLSGCPAFATLEPEALANVADKMVLERFPVGARVIRQGDEGDKFFVINRGRVDVLRDDGGGPRKIATLQEGNFFGEMALLQGELRNATVTATEDLEVYSLDKPSFRAAIDTTRPFNEQILKVYYQRQ
jgi:putative ABC transport system ATP-binding protein